MLYLVLNFNCPEGFFAVKFHSFYLFLPHSDPNRSIYFNKISSLFGGEIVGIDLCRLMFYEHKNQSDIYKVLETEEVLNFANSN